MKTFAILSMTFLFALAVTQTQAPVMAKAQMKGSKKELKSERKELKKLKGSNVSELTKTHFYTDFGDVPNVDWKRIDTFDQASFTQNGQKMKAFYDEDANLVGTTSVKSFADLPEKGQKEIKTKYKGYTPGPVIFYDDNEVNETDMILYGTQFDDADNYFVELTKGAEKIIVMVNPTGYTSFFKKL